MIKDIADLAKPGFVNDQPPMGLAAGGWTDSRNVKYRDGAAEKCSGYVQAFGGDISVTAIWASPVSDGTNYFWAYGSNTVMYATDGTTHANITGTITLAATDDLNYSGGPFHGYLIVNDGAAIPQTWTPGFGNDLVSLTAWPALVTCKVMRPFKDFLFAFRIIDGSYNPRLMRWSDRAAFGALPQSWDYADPTNQAGINELGQTQDAIVDGLPLRDSLMIYKENHTWVADYIGTDDIFTFRQVFSNVGMLSERCAIAVGSNHLVWTDQDIVLHDGNEAKSIIDKRARKWLFNRINVGKYKRSYAYADFRERTAYFCFPETGQDWPTLKLCWNWAEDTLHVEQMGGPKTWVENGLITNSVTSFDADTGTFDSLGGGFDDENYSPFAGYPLILDASAKRAYQGNTGDTFNGTAMVAYAERSGWPLKPSAIDMIHVSRIYPRVMGTTGDVLDFYFGVRATQGAAVSWRGPYPFTIGVDYKIDLRLTGRLLDFSVASNNVSNWRLHGLSFEVEDDGER